jgi:hypothetical protein
MIPQDGQPAAVAQEHRQMVRLARVAGALFLPVLVLGPFSLLFVRARLVVPGDAAATADRIAADGWLLRVGSVIELYLALTDVALAALFYVVLSPVNRPLALVASYFRLSWAVVAAVAVLANMAALRILDDAGYMTAFTADESHAQALLLLDLHEDAIAVGFVAFGVHLLIVGYLIARSNLIPRTVGVMLVVAGTGYVVNSLLIVGVATAPQPLLLLPAFAAELALCLWLLVKGVRPLRTPEPVPASAVP